VLCQLSAECPVRAIQLIRYRDRQVGAEIMALLEPELVKTE